MRKALYWKQFSFENINTYLKLWEEQRLKGFLNVINEVNLVNMPLFSISCVTGTVMSAGR